MIGYFDVLKKILSMADRSFQRESPEIKLTDWIGKRPNGLRITIFCWLFNEFGSNRENFQASQRARRWRELTNDHCAEFVDHIVAGSFAIRQSETIWCDPDAR
jgi:hypothetical protein